MVTASNAVGGGKYNLTAAAQLRFERIVESQTSNPEFFFSFPRFATAYAEAAFPISFFVGGPAADNIPDNLAATLDLKVARGFFQDSRMPKNFHRREGPLGLNIINSAIGFLINAQTFVPPGANNGAGNYTVDQFALDVLQGEAKVDLVRPFV